MDKENIPTDKKEKPSAEENRKKVLEQIKAAKARYEKDIYLQCREVLKDEKIAQTATDITFERISYIRKNITEKRLEGDHYNPPIDIEKRLKDMAVRICSDIKELLRFKHTIDEYCCESLLNKEESQSVMLKSIKVYVYKRERSPDILADWKAIAKSICEDVLLVKSVKNNKIIAYESLFKKYKTELLNYCRYLLPCNEDAEGVVEEAFVKVFKNIHKIKDPASFYSYIRRTAFNECQKELKKIIKWKKINWIMAFILSKKIKGPYPGQPDENQHGSVAKNAAFAPSGISPENQSIHEDTEGQPDNEGNDPYLGQPDETEHESAANDPAFTPSGISPDNQSIHEDTEGQSGNEDNGDGYRVQPSGVPFHSGIPNPEEHLMKKEDEINEMKKSEMIDQLLKELPVKHRLVIIGRREGLSHREIAELMGATEENSRLWHKRGMDKLLKLVDKYGMRTN